VAPHIAAPAESATQTAGAVALTAIAVIWSTSEAAAKVVAAKTITSANITRARIGILCAVLRSYMVLASHSGSCEHGCGDQCSRQKFKLSHSVFPLI
jgi:hypothetical protein